MKFGLMREKMQIRRILKYSFEVVFLLLLLLYLVTEIQKYAHKRVEEWAEKLFTGDVVIGKVKVTSSKLFVEDIYVNDVTTPPTISFLYIKSLQIPIPYHKIFGAETPIANIYADGFSLSVVKSEKGWNIKRNIIFKKEAKEHKTAFRKLNIEKGFLSVSTPSESGLVTYPFTDITADLEFIDRKTVVNIKGTGKNTSFKGKLRVEIPERSPEDKVLGYSVVFDDFDFYACRNLMRLIGLKGEAIVRGSKLNINKISGAIGVQEVKVPFNKLLADCHFSTNSFIIDSYKADLLGGGITGKAEYTFDESYLTEFKLTDIEVGEMVKAHKGINTPVSGKFNLEARLVSTRSDAWMPKGEGAAQARDVMVPGDNSIKSAEIQWIYKDETLFADEIKVVTKKKSYFGKGTISKEGILDIYFTTEGNRGVLRPIPVIGFLTSKITGTIKNELLAFKIEGTLREPKFGVQSVERIPKRTFGYVSDIIKAVAAPVTKPIKKSMEKQKRKE